METKPNFKTFTACALQSCTTLKARAVAFTYFRSRFEGGKADLVDLMTDFETAGLGKQRVDRLRAVLIKDRYTKKVGTNSWMIPSDRFRDVETELNLDQCMVQEVEQPQVKKNSIQKKKVTGSAAYIDLKRIKELKKIVNPTFDLSRLLKICAEINDNFSQGNNISTILLVRTLVDHIAPTLGHKTFVEVANNYSCGKSLKDTLQHLENSSRKIADGHLHTPVRKKEVLPTATQVNFSQDVDVLLGEIVRILK